MAKLRSLPDDVEFECADGETVLEAARRAGLPLANACGGKAKCSTCRIWLLEGAHDLPPPNEDEARLIERVGLANDIRLACQLIPTGNLNFRRLVLDLNDLRMASQLNRDSATKSGTLKPVVIFFSDISGFTSFSETLTPYDVMYLLNRYFSQVGEYIESNNGYIDKFVGDGLMAIFGVDDQQDAPVRAVNAALQTLAAVDRLKPFFKSMFDIDFDIRIGLHHGEAVIGSVGSHGNERLTAVGDAVNVASRVEVANKEAGTRLLISEPLYELVKSQVDMTDFLRVRLRGTSDRITLYEISGLTQETDSKLNAAVSRQTLETDGLSWTSIAPSDTLQEGEHKIFVFPGINVAVARREQRIFAFDNACPHLDLPMFEDLQDGAQPDTGTSKIDDHAQVVCRWHESVFDLHSGATISWCGKPVEENETGEGSDLKIIPCREEAGQIWLNLEDTGPAAPN